jgi:2-polyprenyl-6-methoxyphenol hydroxylase-like FAD-dependent oxidoreductase
MNQSSKFSDTQTVVIAGGEVAGLLSALLLARAGKRVLIRERRPDFVGPAPSSGRSFNFTLYLRGRNVLRRAGILGSALAQHFWLHLEESTRMAANLKRANI